MLPSNAEKIMSMLAPSDLVLDIGAWGYPFNRANWAMDCEPYETRGYYNREFFRDNPLPPQGGAVEHFTRERWIHRDICGREPFPFADKQLDFVICSHTLEDIRDPLWVCSEMVRIAKRGYLEVPSRLKESCRGDHPGIVGLSHHRWLIDIEDNSVRFWMKPHLIHSHWRYSLPERVCRSLTADKEVQWLFWEGSFAFDERIIHGNENQLAELQRFVDANVPYSPPMRALAAAEESSRRFIARAGRAWRKIASGGRAARAQA
jgi:hypothetical protein